MGHGIIMYDYDGLLPQDSQALSNGPMSISFVAPLRPVYLEGNVNISVLLRHQTLVWGGVWDYLSVPWSVLQLEGQGRRRHPQDDTVDWLAGDGNAFASGLGSIGLDWTGARKVWGTGPGRHRRHRPSRYPCKPLLSHSSLPTEFFLGPRATLD